MSNAATRAAPHSVVSVLELKEALESLPACSRLSDASADALYSLAYHQSAQGRLTTALQYFTLLALYRPTHPGYLQGLAQTYRMMKRYDEALNVYSFLAAMHAENTSYTLAIAECLLLRGDVQAAMHSVHLVLRYCKAKDAGSSADADTMERAKALSDLLTNAIERAATDA